MNNQNNIFKNSGIRAKTGEGFLQTKHLTTLGYAIGSMLAQEFEISCPILIATDTRPSGQAIKQALMEGLLKSGHDVFDAGICPTPFVAKALKDYQPHDDDEQDFQNNDLDEDENFFILGIVITASHNPAQYNGIKILTPFGYLSTEMEQEISNVFHDFCNDPSLIEDEQPEEDGIVVDFDLVSWYQSQIIDELKHSSFKKSVLLDCANGATAQIAPAIFKSLGFITTAINNSLDGTKINQDSGCGNPQLLLKAMAEHNTDWGCAFDGDGDRVIIAHRNGTIFDGDDVVSVLATHERYHNIPTIVGTILSNQGLQNYLEQHQKELIRTPVGERNIIDALIKHQAFLGCEPCGHITMMDHAFCSDGIFAALMFFDTIASDKKLENLMYQKHTQVHANIALNNKVISVQTIKQIVAEYTNANKCRIIVRPSDTEPVLRLMVECSDEKQAQTILQNLHAKCMQALNKN